MLDGSAGESRPSRYTPCFASQRYRAAMQDNSWSTLEDTVVELCEAYTRIKRENRQLRDQQQTLLERNAALRSRLESLLEKVRVLESETEA